MRYRAERVGHYVKGVFYVIALLVLVQSGTENSNCRCADKRGRSLFTFENIVALKPGWASSPKF